MQDRLLPTSAAARTLDADPLRVLGLSEVVRRTGYSKRTLMRMLAEDRIDNAPGRRFPAPLRSRYGMNRLEWREKAIVEWIERREQQ